MLLRCLALVTVLLYTGAGADPCLPQDGGIYRIINRNSNKALNVRDQSTADGAQIEQRQYTDDTSEKWKISRYFDSYVFINQYSNRVIGFDPSQPNSNGAKVQQFLYNFGGANQRWRIQEASGGFCKITSDLNDKAMEVKEWSNVDGADVQLWDYAAGRNQEWRLEVVSNQTNQCAPGWGLIKQFDFSSAGQAVQDWNLITLPTGYYNHEKQRYTNSSQNVFFRNNHLVLKAIRDGILPPPAYTSGRVESKQTYTPFEAPGKKLRIEFTGKVPTPPGSWPAYWLVGDEKTYGGWPATGEIDVMEWAYHWSGIYPATIHYGGDPSTHEQAQRNFSLGAQDMARNFITYGVEWSVDPDDGYIQYYYRRQDGSTIVAPKIGSMTWSDFPNCPAGKSPNNFPCSTAAPFDNHMRIVINLAVGGDFGGDGVTDYTAFDDGVEFETSNVVVCEKL